MLSNVEAIEEDMKKQYIKPQTKEVVIRLYGSVLSGDISLGKNSGGLRSIDSRQSNAFEDDEDEIEDSMWK